MNVNQEVRLNLSADGIPPRLFMPQGDANSRTIVATLWDGATPYSVPANAAVMVRFRKPDGTGGLYDATEAGTAVTASGNTVTAPVATQMLAVAGVVQAEIDIYGTGAGKAADRLATFRFAVEVAPSVYPDAQIISSDYFNLIAATIAEAVEAAAKAEQAQAAAESAKTAAESAKAGAQAAQQGAETAKDAAQAAQSAAENAKAGAQAAQSGAESAKQGAQSAQAAAESAKTAAENAKAGAQSAQQGAQTAQQGAEAAQDAAEDAQAAAAASAAAAAASAANAATSVEGAVKYNTPQSLTPAQQAQARENINAPAPYTAGQNISISGTTIGTKAFPCNPNLLDNWYFGNPVNQKGQTSWSGLSDYGMSIDRWVYSPSTVASLTSNGVTVTADWQQYVENTRFLVGQQFTMSVLTSDGRLGQTTFAFVEGIDVNVGVGVGYLVIYNGQGDTRTICRIYGDGSTYLAAKLELGSVQTLAHQENGVWMLNEIPKFGDQLAECQRYSIDITPNNKFNIAFLGELGTNSASFVVPIPVTMRANSTFIGDLAQVQVAVESAPAYYTPTAVSITDMTSSTVTITFAFTHDKASGTLCSFRSTSDNAKFLLSAEL